MNNIIKIRVIIAENGTLDFITDTLLSKFDLDFVPQIRMEIANKPGWRHPRYEPLAFRQD